MRTVGEIFKDVVEQIQVDGIPFYDYGHPLNVINRLAEKTNNGQNFDKFPLIALFLDAPEVEDLKKGTRFITVDLIICCSTLPQYTEVERTVNSFNLVLYPIYEELKKQFEFGKLVNVDGEINKIDRYNWGKTGLYGNTANIFNDYVDAIEINKLKLEILKTC